MNRTFEIRSLLLPALLAFNFATPSLSYAVKDHVRGANPSTSQILCPTVLASTPIAFDQSRTEWRNVSIDNVDKGLQKKVHELIGDIFEKGRLGKPELLRGFYKGAMSRRINDEHRLVYQLDRASGKLVILECGGHYRHS